MDCSQNSYGVSPACASSECNCPVSYYLSKNDAFFMISYSIHKAFKYQRDYGKVTLECYIKIVQWNQDVIFIWIIMCIKSMILIVYLKCPKSRKLVIAHLLQLFLTAKPAQDMLILLIFLFLVKYETKSSKQKNRTGMRLSSFLTLHFLQQPGGDKF